MKKILILVPLLLVGCTGQKIITDENVFENIVAEDNQIEFFAPKNPKDIKKCIPVANLSCVQEQISLGNRLDVAEFQVSVRGNSIQSKDIEGKLLAAAAIVAAQQGFDYIIPTISKQHYYESKKPVANTYGYSGYNTVFYETSITEETFTFYTKWLQFVAYNDIEDVKNGIVTNQRTLDEKLGNIYDDLFLNKDMSVYKTNIATLEQPTGYAIYEFKKEAWKNYYDVNSIIEGENLQNIVGSINVQIPQKEYQESINDKYKQKTE